MKLFRTTVATACTAAFATTALYFAFQSWHKHPDFDFLEMAFAATVLCAFLIAGWITAENGEVIGTFARLAKRAATWATESNRNLVVYALVCIATIAAGHRFGPRSFNAFSFPCEPATDTDRYVGKRFLGLGDALPRTCDDQPQNIGPMYVWHPIHTAEQVLAQGRCETRGRFAPPIVEQDEDRFRVSCREQPELLAESAPAPTGTANVSAPDPMPEAAPRPVRAVVRAPRPLDLDAAHASSSDLAFISPDRAALASSSSTEAVRREVTPIAEDRCPSVDWLVEAVTGDVVAGGTTKDVLVTLVGSCGKSEPARLSSDLTPGGLVSFHLPAAIGTPTEIQFCVEGPSNRFEWYPEKFLVSDTSGRYATREMASWLGPAQPCRAEPLGAR